MDGCSARELTHLTDLWGIIYIFAGRLHCQDYPMKSCIFIKVGWLCSTARHLRAYSSLVLPESDSVKASAGGQGWGWTGLLRPEAFRSNHPCLAHIYVIPAVAGIKLPIPGCQIRFGTTAICSFLRPSCPIGLKGFSRECRFAL
jgi:hypothetical protein